MSVTKIYNCDCCGAVTNPPGVGNKAEDGIARFGQLKARVWSETKGLVGHYIHPCGDCALKIENFLSNLIVLKSDN